MKIHTWIDDSSMNLTKKERNFRTHTWPEAYLGDLVGCLRCGYCHVFTVMTINGEYSVRHPVHCYKTGITMDEFSCDEAIIFRVLSS